MVLGFSRGLSVFFWIVISAAGLLILINAIAFWMFAWDKWCAENHRWRIPEANLLFISLIGGSIGAITAQQWLRHKTRKEPFATLLFSIAVGQVLLLFGLLYSPTRQMFLQETIGSYRRNCLTQVLQGDTSLAQFASYWKRA